MTARPPAARFSIGEAIGVGWRGFTGNIGAMALYALIVLGVSILVNLVFSPFEGRFATFVANVVAFTINQLVAIGWLRIALDIIDRGRADLSRVSESFDVLVPYIIAAVLFSIAVTIGLILLIIPGIIAAIVLGFYGWILVDRSERDAIAALRHSIEITRGEWLRLFLLGIALLALNLLGLLLFIVGVIVTSAVSILALAHVYRRLEETAHGAGGMELGGTL